MVELPRLTTLGGLFETILNSLARRVKAEDVHGFHRGDSRLGWAHGSAVRDAWLGRYACVHGRVHRSVATHGLVVHGLNFMDD